MEIVYRRLQPKDAESYRAARLECLKNFPDRFGSTFEEESRQPKLKFEKIIEEDETDNFMFGAFADGKLIGIAGFSRAERRKTAHRGEIVQMYVNPDFRGQAVGENLLQNVIEEAFALTGIESVELSVVADNAAAIKLYEKLGFKAYGWQKNYFKDGERYWDQQFMQLLKEDYDARKLS